MKTAASVIIDGKADEQSWKAAEWSESFQDIEGLNKPSPKYETKVKMLWDESNLYIYAWLQEEDLHANLKQRDTVIFHDNDFEIFIDPDGDTHNYYEFELNAFNTLWDLLLLKPYRDGKEVALNGWDCKGFKSAIDLMGTLNDPNDIDTGWSIEISIPWTSLEELAGIDSPPKSGDYWRLNFSRVQWETEIVNNKYRKRTDIRTGRTIPESNWVWSPQGLIAMHYPEMWGYVLFADSDDSNPPEFELSPLESVKWELRKIYYHQKSYYILNGIYAESYRDLGIDLVPIEGYTFPPEIRALEKTYYAECFSNDLKENIIIFSDGRIIVNQSVKVK